MCKCERCFVFWILGLDRKNCVLFDEYFGQSAKKFAAKKAEKDCIDLADHVRRAWQGAYDDLKLTTEEIVNLLLDAANKPSPSRPLFSLMNVQEHRGPISQFELGLIRARAHLQHRQTVATRCSPSTAFSRFISKTTS